MWPPSFGLVWQNPQLVEIWGKYSCTNGILFISKPKTWTLERLFGIFSCDRLKFDSCDFISLSLLRFHWSFLFYSPIRKVVSLFLESLPKVHYETLTTKCLFACLLALYCCNRIQTNYAANKKRDLYDVTMERWVWVK